MARVLKGSHSFTCTPRVHLQWNEPYLPLPSHPKLVPIYRPWRDGRLSWPILANNSIYYAILCPYNAVADDYQLKRSMMTSRSKINNEKFVWRTKNIQPARTPIILIIASFATAAGDTVSFTSSSSGTYTMRSQLEHFSQTDVPQITQLWRRWINPNWSWHLLHRSAILPYCNSEKIISCSINHQ